MSAVRCWEDGPQDAEGVGSSCMLDDGHDGGHDFISDRFIEVTFANFDHGQEGCDGGL